VTETQSQKKARHKARQAVYDAIKRTRLGETVEVLWYDKTLTLSPKGEVGDIYPPQDFLVRSKKRPGFQVCSVWDHPSNAYTLAFSLLGEKNTCRKIQDKDLLCRVTEVKGLRSS
jgi:hypothetical protein